MEHALSGIWCKQTVILLQTQDNNADVCLFLSCRRFVRSQVIFANTMFRAVCYCPDECQIITAGTDRKIGYWETYDGSQIRELDGSKSASINGMDIYSTHFVTGGGDKLIKVGVVERKIFNAKSD